VARPRITINIDPTQARNSFAPLRVHYRGISRGVLSDNCEFDLGSDTEFVVLNRHNKTLSECLSKSRLHLRRKIEFTDETKGRACTRPASFHTGQRTLAGFGTQFRNTADIRTRKIQRENAFRERPSQSTSGRIEYFSQV
jgi:hypothetical protein